MVAARGWDDTVRNHRQREGLRAQDRQVRGQPRRVHAQSRDRPAFTVRPRNLVFTVAGPAGTIHAIGRMFRMQLQDNQQVRLTVAGQDALGNDIPTDKLGDLTAVSSDDRIVTVAAESPGVFLVKAVAGADSTSASVLVSDDVNA